MAVNLLVHPVLGALTVALILATFAAKAGRTKYVRLHYALALAALGAAAVSFVAGLLTVLQALGEGIEFEETAVFHLGVAAVLLMVLVVQARWGLRMWRPKQPGYLPYHRALGRVVALLAVVLAVLGLVTLVTIH